MILDALTLPEAHPATRRLAEAFGGEPVEVKERRVGEPVLLSRRLLYASGGEIILHDDAVAAVILRLAPTPAAPYGLDLSTWIAGADNDATLDDLKEALGTSFHFAGFGQPYFTLDGGYARSSFKDNRGWKDAGNLRSISITAEKPGLACRPEDDDCPACSELLVRQSDPDRGIDVDRTIDSLTAALEAGALTEDAHWVRLADLRLLHTSGLMERVESQLTCTTCRRIICFTLPRESTPTFGYYALNDARGRPLESIPPVAQWGDAARIAAEGEAMHYLDHEPGAWFLVEQQGTVYIDARYSYSAMIDDSALIRLDESEREAYDAGGRDYVSDLAERIHNSGPYRADSPFYSRNLYRGPDGTAYRQAVAGAIVNNTWIAQQRRSAR